MAYLLNIEAVCHIYVSADKGIIASNNGLLPVRHQAITPSIAGLLLNEQWNLNQNSYISIEENVLEKVVWKIAAIVSRPQFVNIMICFSKLERLWVKWSI